MYRAALIASACTNMIPQGTNDGDGRKNHHSKQDSDETRWTRQVTMYPAPMLITVLSLHPFAKNEPWSLLSKR